MSEATKDRILLVDDEPEVVSAIRRQIRRWAREHELEIVVAESGEEALAFFESSENRIAVVLTDNRMPAMSGVDLVRTLMKRQYSAVPLLITGYTEPHDMRLALSSGVLNLLVKPWTKEKLLSELDAALTAYYGRRRTKEAPDQTEHENAHLIRAFQREVLRTPPLVELGDMSVEQMHRSTGRLDVAGDYLDIAPLGGSRYLLLLGDVSQPGLRSNAVLGIIKNLTREEYLGQGCPEDCSPAGYLRWLNTRLLPIIGPISGLVVTFTACLIDSDRKRATVAVAGAPFPAVIDESGMVDEVAVMGVALGITESPEYEDHDLDIGDQKQLILSTDRPGSDSSERREREHTFVSMVATLEPELSLRDQIISRRRSGDMESCADCTLVRVQADRLGKEQKGQLRDLRFKLR